MSQKKSPPRKKKAVPSAVRRFAPEMVRSAIFRMLQSIVRFALRNDVRFKELSELLKRAACECALRELEENEVFNISKISLASGVHRKDVQRIVIGRVSEISSSDIVTRVLGAWQSNKKYLDSNGSPRVLDCRGTESEFAELVRKISREVSIYPVISELLRSKTVEKNESNLRLLVREYIPLENMGEGFNILASDLEDLISSVTNNLLAGVDAENAHFSTQYDNIPKQHLLEIRKWFHAELGAMHQRARAFIGKFDRDNSLDKELNESDDRYRVALGTFSQVENYNEFYKRKRSIEELETEVNTPKNKRAKANEKKI